MLACVHSSTLLGIDAHPVEVEVDITSSLTKFDLVGLPDAAVMESRERVRAAIQNSGYAFPLKKIVVNLAPGDVRKAGAMYDLPIAVRDSRRDRADRCRGAWGLACCRRACARRHGSLGPRVLPTAIRALEEGRKGLVCPHANRNEASLVSALNVYPISHLREIIDHLGSYSTIQPFHNGGAPKTIEVESKVDFAEVQGQESAKRACEIAAAGHHNLLMMGPPGSGKSMIAKRLSTILPALSFEEALEVTKIHSIMGLVGENNGLVRQRPFRSPHHTISAAGLVGGG